MAYPSYNQLYGSEFIPDGGIAVSVAPWGEHSTRTTFGARRPGVFSLLHMLTAAEWATLLSNYTSNVSSTQSFTWQEDSTSWTVQWAATPQAVRVGPDVFSVTARLRVVINYESFVLEQDDAEDLILLESGDEILTEGAS